jgi:hypothetical protein
MIHLHLNHYGCYWFYYSFILLIHFLYTHTQLSWNWISLTLTHSNLNALTLTHSNLNSLILTHSNLNALTLTHSKLNSLTLTHSNLNAHTPFKTLMNLVKVLKRNTPLNRMCSLIEHVLYTHRSWRWWIWVRYSRGIPPSSERERFLHLCKHVSGFVRR